MIMNSTELNLIEQRSISTQVYESIKNSIMLGELKSGERISEQSIAERLGISRTPVREGLRMLEQYGLVKLKARSYAEVIKLNENEMKNLVSIRAELEGFSVKLLIAKNNEDDFVMIKKSAKECEDLLSTGTVSDVFKKDSMFHLEIATRTGNQYLVEILERLDAKIQIYRVSQCITKGEIAIAVRTHNDIVDAITNRDTVSAVSLMEKHCKSHFVID
jgi:GntR family transcriptional regulator, rspAB operon transcriptional repressor